MQPRRLYLDNSATSFPKPPCVLEAMTHYAMHLGASAGRGAYFEAIETGRLIQECRERLNRLFDGEKPEHWIFTLNCSDALNIAIKGLVYASSKSRPHCICTHIDHNSILRPLNALADAGAIEQTRIEVEPGTGLVDPEAIRRAIRPDTLLIAITHVSNVTGTVQPVREIGAIAREGGIAFVVDAAQSAGHLPIDVSKDNIDLLAVPGHKGLFGPLGTGALYIHPGVENRMVTIREGGTGSVSENDRQPDFMPDRFEPGSHNAIGIIGLSAGVQWILERGIETIWSHEQDLIRTFIDGLDLLDRVHFFGPQGIRHRAGVFSVAVDGWAPVELAGELEERFGILSRPGLHCAPLAHAAIGTVERGGTTRLSFGPFLSPQDVYYATNALADIATPRAAAVGR